MGLYILQAGLPGERQMRKAVLRARRAIFDADRVSPAKVTLEDFFVWSNANGSKRAGVHAVKTGDAIGLVNHHCPGLLVHIHSSGHRTSYLAQGFLAVPADNWSRQAIFSLASHFYSCQIGIEFRGFSDGTHYFTHPAAIAQLFDRPKNPHPLLSPGI